MRERILPQKQSTSHQWGGVDVLQHRSSEGREEEGSPERKILGKKLTCSVNSYRAGQLGVCAIHNLVTALTSFYKIENCSTKIWRDNQGIVDMTKKKKKRVRPICRPGASCADILRNIRSSVRNKTAATISHGHLD